MALGAAAELARADIADGGPHRLQAMRDRLHEVLAHAVPGQIALNGHPERRLPNTLNISISGARGHELLVATPDIAAAAGSTCHAGTTDPSPVLIAMGLDRDRALAAVRLTLGRWSNQGDVDRAGDLLTAAARGLHRGAGHIP